jgi:outer membrane protein TolC
MNKKKNILTIAGWFLPVFFLWTGNLTARHNINDVLQSVAQHNTTLKALRETINAQQLEKRIDIFLPGPEVEFNYLRGNPQAIGNRTDISLTQTFDIATLLGMKNKMANQQHTVLEIQYRTGRANILLEAKQYCIDVIYCNALKKELDVRLQQAEAIAHSYRERLDRGDVSILEYNKAQLSLSTVQQETARVEIARKAALQELKRLNGGIAIAPDDDKYPAGSDVLPASFEEWFAAIAPKHPLLEELKEEIEAGKRQLSIAKAMNWPALSVGYMSESVTGETFQGLKAGLSIPLWENKNRTKQARASLRATESREADMRQQLYARLQNLYDQASGLQQIVLAARASLQHFNNTVLLQKALDAGEISILDYLIEVNLYYDAITQTLEAERDFEKTLAELLVVELVE